MKVARRQAEVYRLVVTHGWTTAQLEAALPLPAGQVATTLATLRARGSIEETANGWQRRRSDLRSWVREEVPRG